MHVGARWLWMRRRWRPYCEAGFKASGEIVSGWEKEREKERKSSFRIMGLHIGWILKIVDEAAPWPYMWCVICSARKHKRDFKVYYDHRICNFKLFLSYTTTSIYSNLFIFYNLLVKVICLRNNVTSVENTLYWLISAYIS